MKVDIEGLEVYFPYSYMYPEQLAYMTHLKRTLDQERGHCLLEMPTGTGKSVCLLSLITSFQLSGRPGPSKLVYCTRTVQEMDKVLDELQRVVEFQTRLFAEQGQKRLAMLGLCLSSRRNMCVHPVISSFENREQVDALCRDRTASWVREAAAGDNTIETCAFYDEFEAAGVDTSITGIYALEDIKALGQRQGWCPYFVARQLIAQANIVVYNYQYMLDPKISSLVSKEIDGSNTVVVFDEAHNIDNICIEALSVFLTRRTLNAASSNIAKLNRQVDRAQQQDAARLQEEYQRLVEGLQQTQSGGETVQAAPVLEADVLHEAVPGNIRRAKHFLLFMSTVLQYFKTRLGERSVTEEDPAAFLQALEAQSNFREFQTKALKFAHDRLQSLLRTLRVTHLDEFTPLTMVCNFATLAATYNQGFAVLLEPWDDRLPGVPDPKLHLACLDASIAMRPVLDKFRCVVITSGTLSPIDLYPRLLHFTPRVAESLSMSVSERTTICPMIAARGNDQVELTTRFEKRDDQGVVSNYGRLIADLAMHVPDGIVCFFPSYSYMENVLMSWSESGLLKSILQHKLLFVETQDIVETSLALDSFKKACDCGRGAIFFSIARGKVAEGIDFDKHYGRCVVLIGIPFQYTLSRVLRARMRFLKDHLQIEESDFLSFDALRQASQCVGRVIRSKIDYGVMIFADQRYKRSDKLRKLPRWITQYMPPGNQSCSIDQVVDIATTFLKRMGQPHVIEDEIGVTLLTKEQIEAKRVL